MSDKKIATPPAQETGRGAILGLSVLMTREQVADMNREFTRLQAEIERLREALEELRAAGAHADEHGLEVDGSWLSERADAALRSEQPTPNSEVAK